MKVEAARIPVGGYPAVADLVTRARDGDQQAWDTLVERYCSLIWSICRGYRLPDADAADVSHSVWLHLVDHLDRIRDPAALAGWLASTTRRECGRILRAPGAPGSGSGPDARNIPDEQTQTAEQELRTAERHAALNEAITDLLPGDRQLIALLAEDPPVPYARISNALGIPVRSIGPGRRRCLDKLRRHPAIAALIAADTAPAGQEQ